MVKAMLFMASDNRESKIAVVLRDALALGADFKENDFNLTLMRMMVADSVNILQNIEDVEIDNGLSKEDRVSWKAIVQTQNLHGGDGGDHHFKDLDDLKKYTSEFKLPEIAEIGIYAKDFVNGI